MALQQHPMLNASIDDEKEEVIYKQYINIGIAVDTPRGLVVPALRNDRPPGHPADRPAAKHAWRKRPAPWHFRSTTSAAALSRSATWARSAARTARRSSIIPKWRFCSSAAPAGCPWSRDEKIETRFMLPLSLSFDHRLVDGAAAARFLNDVIDLLQNPGKLLLTS